MKKHVFHGVVFFLFAFVFPSIIFAQLAPNYTTYQARIIKPDNSALEDSDVTFRFTILDPTANCTLYVENFSNIDMSNSAGNVAFTLGTGSSTYISAGHTNMIDIFSNSPTAPFTCQGGGGPYSPSANHSRKITMAFMIAGQGWQVLPAMAINSVPYANYSNLASRAVSATFATLAASATAAATLNGYTQTDFATSVGLGVCPSNEVLTYTVGGFDCVPVASVSGTLTNITANAPLIKTGSASSPILSITQAASGTDGYLSSADFISFSQKLNATSASIATVLGAQALTVSSTINLSGDVTGDTTNAVVSFVNGKTASQISTSVDDTIAATAAATPSTLAKRDISGNIQFNNIGSNITSMNRLNLYNGANAISFLSPVLASSYTLTLPASSGAVGQVLTTDGAGILSWTSPSAGAVASVSGTANEITVTGVTNAVISLSNNGVVSGTYTKVTVDSKGRVSSGSQLVASDIISALTYTPFNAADSGTLPLAGDVTGTLSATVVTQVGGKTSATISTVVDVVSAATSLNVSNTIVRRDGSGNFAASQGTFENSVVVKDGSSGGAIGLYAPIGVTSYNLTLPTTSGTANQVLTTNGVGVLSWTTPAAASASQWTTSGTSVYYNAGNVGIGDNNPQVKLSIFDTVTNATDPVFNVTNTVSSNWYVPLFGGYTPNLQPGGRAQLAFGRSPNSGNRAEIDFTYDGNANPSNRIEMGFWDNNAILNILYSGRVGIGTTTPATTFEVSGTLKFAGATAPVSGGVLTSDASGIATWRIPASVSGSQWTTSGTNIFYNTGNVGIGVSSPIGKLQIDGVLIINPTNFIHNPNSSFESAKTGDNYLFLNGSSRSGGLAATSDGLITASQQNLRFRTNVDWAGDWDSTGVEAMTILSSGLVGIGTETPRSALDVSGTVLFKPSTVNTTTTINFALGNLQHTANDCGTFALHNMQDGGSYTFAVKGTNATTCIFNAFSGAGVGALTVHMPTDHGITTATKHTLYSFLVMGTDVYVTWMPGL